VYRYVLSFHWKDKRVHNFFGECSNMEKIKVGEVFSISDETGEEQDVEVLGVVTIEEREYVAVGFLEDLEEDTEDDIDIFFLKIDEEGDFSAIESDEEFEKVSSAFDEIFDEELEED
jgi:uncharacterized protein YrzB (UPF0473 family)